MTERLPAALTDELLLALERALVDLRMACYEGDVSLDALSEEEHRQLWAEEAARRDAELDADPARGRPAEAVVRDARARLAHPS